MWGNNSVGQFGDGTYTSRPTPGPVAGLDGVVQISAGGSHVIALRSDGTVWAWGSGSAIGNGSPAVDRTRPVAVAGLAGVVQVASAAEFAHSFALLSDGTVRAWGRNNSGALGDGTTVQQLRPVVVNGLSGVISLATGVLHSTALTADGQVWAWGWNNAGQLGDGTFTDRALPGLVPGVTGVVYVGTGGDNVTALKGDRTVVGWGANDSGSLGNGTNRTTNTPVPAPAFTGATQLDGGYSYTLALMGGTTTAGAEGPGLETTELVLAPPSPHPARGATTIRMRLAEVGAVRAELLDALGRSVASLHDGVLPAGWSTLDLDLSAFPAGMYVVRVTSNGQTAMRPVAVVR